MKSWVPFTAARAGGRTFHERAASEKEKQFGSHMSSEDFIGDRPESIADLESSEQGLREKIDALFSQPMDPAILERVNREREDLEMLSRKAVTELSGDEALRLIWNQPNQPLGYTDAPQHFELWWKSIDPATQKEVNFAAEDFEDLTDYQYKCLTSSGGSVMNATKGTLGVRGLYAQMHASMPKITEERFASLWIDAVRRRTILKRGRQRSVVKSFIDDYVDRTRQVLFSTFGIAGNRATSEQKRDRHFSKCRYQGMTSVEIAREWNRDHRRSNHGVTPAGVAKAVRRYRKKREPVIWQLRIWIYQANFPKLTARTCPGCEGNGEIYQTAAWSSWHKRRLDRQDFGSVPQDDPQPPCPPPKRCELCGGTGIRRADQKQ